MKPLSLLFLALVLYSCSKKSDDNTPANEKNTVTATIKLYDRYGHENKSFNDVTIKLIDKQNQVSVGAIAGDGKCRFKNVSMGDVILTLSKPGYGFIDSVKFNHAKAADTLSDLSLIEELPFSVGLFNSSYRNGAFNFSFHFDYNTTDTFLVTTFFCFGKDQNVSMNHMSFGLSDNGYFSAKYINGSLGGGFTMALTTFTSAGFNNGDKVWVVAIPVALKFRELYSDKTLNYKILSYKFGSNASNANVFWIYG